MANQGKIQLNFVIIAPPELAEEGKQLFQSHARWMEATHHREGKKALRSYNLAAGPELSNPMDTSSAPTGNTCFVLSEIYETDAGVADHFEQAMANWQDFPAVGEWLQKCKMSGVAAAPIVHSLW